MRSFLIWTCGRNKWSASSRTQSVSVSFLSTVSVDVILLNFTLVFLLLLFVCVSCFSSLPFSLPSWPNLPPDFFFFFLRQTRAYERDFSIEVKRQNEETGVREWREKESGIQEPLPGA